MAYENYSLDAQYYINSDTNLRPYFTSGFGEIMWERDTNLKVFQVNLGTGLHYKINRNISLQVDWRHYYSFRTKLSENIVASRIVYMFGQGEH